MDAEVRKRTMSARPSVEWPTVVLAAFIYTGWGLLTFFHAVIPLWLLLPLGAWFVAWQTSLQHEIIHGHPTRNRTTERPTRRSGLTPKERQLGTRRRRQSSPPDERIRGCEQPAGQILGTPLQ